MIFDYAYISLFFVSFISATLFPMGSEGLIVYLANADKYSLYYLFFIASIGNTLGSCVNYYLGLKGSDYLVSKKYLSINNLQKSQHIFDKYGAFTLLLSWLPIIGDPITFVAGVLKYKFIVFFIIVLFAKSLRYAILLALF